MNKGTSARSAASSTGNSDMPSVQRANRMAERRCLGFLGMVGLFPPQGVEIISPSLIHTVRTFLYMQYRKPDCQDMPPMHACDSLHGNLGS